MSLDTSYKFWKCSLCLQIPTYFIIQIQAASKWRSEFANHLAIISAIYLLIYHSLLSSLLLLFTILAKEFAHFGQKSHHLEAASTGDLMTILTRWPSWPRLTKTKRSDILLRKRKQKQTWTAPKFELIFSPKYQFKRRTLLPTQAAWWLDFPPKWADFHAILK